MNEKTQTIIINIWEWGIYVDFNYDIRKLYEQATDSLKGSLTMSRSKSTWIYSNYYI